MSTNQPDFKTCPTDEYEPSVQHCPFCQYAWTPKHNTAFDVSYLECEPCSIIFIPTQGLLEWKSNDGSYIIWNYVKKFTRLVFGEKPEIVNNLPMSTFTHNIILPWHSFHQINELKEKLKIYMTFS